MFDRVTFVFDMSMPAQIQNTKSSNEFNPTSYRGTLSISEAAKLLGVSTSTLRRYESEGKVTSTRKPNGYRTFDTLAIIRLRESLDVKKTREVKTKSSVIPEVSVSETKLQTVLQNKVGANALLSINLLQLKNLLKNKVNYKTIFTLVTTIAVFLLSLNFNLWGLANEFGKDLWRSGVFRDILGGENVSEYDTAVLELLGQVLAARNKESNFIFNVNVPSFFKADTTVEANLSVEGDLSVVGLSTLSGGLTTENADGDFGTGTLPLNRLGFFWKASARTWDLC